MKTLIVVLLISLSLGTSAGNPHKVKHRKHAVRLKAVHQQKDEAKPIVCRFLNNKRNMEFRHIMGGETVDKVKAETNATLVLPAGFYGGLTVNGQLKKCAVDLIVIDGKLIYDGQEQKVPSIIKKILDHPRSHRPAVVVQHDHKILCVKDFAAYVVEHGLPLQASQGMLVPPRPNERLPRQFWFNGSPFICWVKMKGTADECWKYALSLGVDPKEFVIHEDGDKTLSPGATTPCFALVY